jgi:hypothetical protein
LPGFFVGSVNASAVIEASLLRTLQQPHLFKGLCPFTFVKSADSTQIRSRTGEGKRCTVLRGLGAKHPQQLTSGIEQVHRADANWAGAAEGMVAMAGLANDTTNTPR